MPFTTFRFYNGTGANEAADIDAVDNTIVPLPLPQKLPVAAPAQTEASMVLPPPPPPPPPPPSQDFNEITAATVTRGPQTLRLAGSLLAPVGTHFADAFTVLSPAPHPALLVCQVYGTQQIVLGLLV